MAIGSPSLGTLIFIPDTYAASVAAVQEDVLYVNEDDRVNLFLIICIILQNTPTRTPKTHGMN
jgi:hypothetical protein